MSSSVAINALQSALSSYSTSIDSSVAGLCSSKPSPATHSLSLFTDPLFSQILSLQNSARDIESSVVGNPSSSFAQRELSDLAVIVQEKNARRLHSMGECQEGPNLGEFPPSQT